MKTPASRLDRLEESISQGCPRCSRLPPLVRLEGGRLTGNHEPSRSWVTASAPTAGRTEW
jgi:hypothetical protein